MRRLPDAATHRDRARRTGRLELDRPCNRSGHRRAIDRRVAEPREPRLGGLGEQDELGRPARPARRPRPHRPGRRPIPSPRRLAATATERRSAAAPYGSTAAQPRTAPSPTTTPPEANASRAPSSVRPDDASRRSMAGQSAAVARVASISSSRCRRSTRPRRRAAACVAVRSTSGVASVGLVALMIALTMPSATACEAVMRDAVRPAASRPSRNSDERQGTGDAAGVRAALGALGPAQSESSATMSVMPIRPPGRSTRAISANTAGLSAARLTTQLLITTSIDSAGSGIASMWPLRNSTFVAPASAALRWARASISSVMSSPNARPVGPTRFADSRTSMPPPEPRSRTRSPACRSATAVGLPHPSEARTAASGSSSRSSTE